MQFFQQHSHLFSCESTKPSVRAGFYTGQTLTPHRIRNYNPDLPASCFQRRTKSPLQLAEIMTVDPLNETAKSTEFVHQRFQRHQVLRPDISLELIAIYDYR